MDPGLKCQLTYYNMSGISDISQKNIFKFTYCDILKKYVIKKISIDIS
jgi:hypothetical protein